MVTVSVIERIKGNKLNIQPYLVTSTREMRRLTDEQIIAIHNQELALKVIPEGSEFLMRWRYSDMRRFLEGETIASNEIFNGIHHLFTTYVDFRSEVESRLLTLWNCYGFLVRYAPTDTPIGARASRRAYDFDPNGGLGYVLHCHILDHEDNEMMRPNYVLLNPQAPAPNRRPLRMGRDY